MSRIFDSLVVDTIAKYVPLRYHNVMRLVFGSSIGIFHVDYHESGFGMQKNRLIEASRYIAEKYEQLFVSCVISNAIVDRDFAMMYQCRGRVPIPSMIDIACDHADNDGMWYYMSYVRTFIHLDFIWAIPEYLRDAWSDRLKLVSGDDIDDIPDNELVILSVHSCNRSNKVINRIAKILASGNDRHFGFHMTNPEQHNVTFVYSRYNFWNNPWLRQVSSLRDDKIIPAVAAMLSGIAIPAIPKKISTLIDMYILIAIDEIDGLVDIDLERFIRERHEVWFPHHLVKRRR